VGEKAMGATRRHVVKGIALSIGKGMAKGLKKTMEKTMEEGVAPAIQKKAGKKTARRISSGPSVSILVIRDRERFPDSILSEGGIRKIAQANLPEEFAPKFVQGDLVREILVG
jgi:hypothetical protein